jgi:hypothetical protein
MNEEIQESITFSYTINGKNFKLSIERRGKERLDGKEIAADAETFLVACGLVESKSYLNSKDLAEKMRTEHELNELKSKEKDGSPTGTS